MGVLTCNSVKIARNLRHRKKPSDFTARVQLCFLTSDFYNCASPEIWHANAKAGNGRTVGQKEKAVEREVFGETEGLIIETTLYGMVAWWCGLQGALIVGTPWAVFIWQSTRLTVTAATVTFNIFKIFGLKTFLSDIENMKILCSCV